MKTITAKRHNLQNIPNFYASRFVAVLLLAVTVEMLLIVAAIFGGGK